jgi:hypothetical protein
MQWLRWLYVANIPFNAANSPYYQPMIDAVTDIDSGILTEVQMSLTEQTI